MIRKLSLIPKNDPLERLRIELSGFWEKETWPLIAIPMNTFIENNGFTDPSKSGGQLKFGELFSSERIKAEIKYACKTLLTNELWNPIGMVDKRSHLSHFSNILQNIDREITSIIDISWAEWEIRILNWYLDNYPKTFKTRSYRQKCENYGYRVVNSKCKPEGLSTIKAIYKSVYNLFDEREEWDKDIVDLEKLGLTRYQYEIKKLNFTRISIKWIRNTLRVFIRQGLVSGKFVSGSANGYINSVSYFSKFIDQHTPLISQPDQVNRKTIDGFIDHVNSLKTEPTSSTSGARVPLSPKTKDQILRHVRVFIRDSGRSGLAPFPINDLFDPEDFPDIPRNVDIQHIPEFVIEQMYHHLDKLVDPWRSMLELCLDLGIRAVDCVLFPLDCLEYDDDNNPYVQFLNHKANREARPKSILDQTYAVIKAAQICAVALAGADCKILFPKDRTGRSYNPQSINSPVREWIIRCDIKDDTGQLWFFKHHQCRHTVGIDIINNGGSEADAMNRLDHVSAKVTRRYAHLVDETKKEEWAKYSGIVIDCTGKVTDNLDEENSLDKQWLKHNLRTQALPNGYCRKPVSKGGCEHANRCLACKAFRTCKGFLSVHRDQLGRCEGLAEAAERNGRTCEANINRVNANRLKRLVERLENIDSGEAVNGAD